MLREQVPGINMTQRQVSDQVGRHEGSCCGNKSQGLIWGRDKSLIRVGDRGVMLRELVPGVNMTQRQVSDRVGRHEGSCCGN